MSSPRPGDRIEVEIDRRSKSGNGIVDIDSEYIAQDYLNIGPIMANAEGKVVKVKVLNDNFAYCLSDSVKGENYDEWFHSQVGSDLLEDLLPDIGERVELTVDRITNSGNLVAFYNGAMIKLTNIVKDDGYSPENDSDEIKVVAERRESDISLPKAEVIEVSDNEMVSLQEAKSLSPDDSVTGRNEIEVSSGVSETLGGSDIDNPDEILSEVDEISEEDASTTSVVSYRTQQYQRSRAVREYVLTRSAGFCEGCGESAPFEDSNGEPYLHAHHVNELSEGGSDSPENVVALCPNCHYRVHHGRDGVEYNEVLIEKLAELEGKSVDEI